jgi:two-component system sensor histidine kinase KdpD
MLQKNDTLTDDFLPPILGWRDHALQLNLLAVKGRIGDARRAFFVKKPIHLDVNEILRNLIRLLLMLTVTTVFSRALFHRGLDESIVIMMYLLTVFFISRMTTGYIYGVLSSLLSVFLFNFFFTEPYYSIIAYDAKYPLIFVIMLVVSLLTSAMTVQIQKTSEEKIRLAQIEEQNRQALASEKLRSTILRSISHDLRSPLTSISGSISVLIDKPELLTEEDRIKLLTDVYNESIWLSRFVENLLSMTRIDDNLLKLNRQPEMIEEIVGETMSRIRRRIGHRTVYVDVSTECGMVEMDAALIEQVLINLIDNAISHTSDTGLIELKTRCDDQNATFSVRNDGPKIHPDEIEHIFDRYFVGSEERSDARRGMGMGLSICKSIVKAHNGTLNVTEPPEGGVVFTFTIPLKGGIPE